ncbi:hypothetical protein SBRCBS47491_006403 [Sporothrix bragantina]|uniref:Cell surface protein n=1 Tax=Sporothrix bragantina TaxID=671064 RepID=A0ABP0C5L9_9PEZI
MPDYNKISQQAEASLNSHQAKTGGSRVQGDDDASINSRAVQGFPGASVQTGDELSTNRGYDRRIPPNEGGDLDAKGRQTRGHNFEGSGGPQEKADEFYRDQGGANDNDVASGRFTASSQRADDSGDVAEFGRQAAQDNLRQKAGGSQFKGSDYFTPESVPDSISAEGNIPPESINQSSREAEFP